MLRKIHAARASLCLASLTTGSSSALSRSVSFSSPLCSPASPASWRSPLSPAGSPLSIQRRFQSSTEKPPKAARRSRKEKKEKLSAVSPSEATVATDALDTPLPVSPPSASLVEPPQEVDRPAEKPRRKRRTKKEMALAREQAATTTASTTETKEEKTDASEGGEEFSLDSFSDLSQDEFFSKLTEEDANRRAELKESTLVYNALNGRMVSDSSPSIQLLQSIGFGINESRQVYVQHSDEVNRLAASLRDGTTPIPSKWPVSLQRTLGTILMNKSIADPAAAVQQMMQIKINSITRSRYASVVTASGEDPEKAEVNGSINLLDDSTDPTKTIELNEEQERVISLALRGHHMYIGGSAGTGKTVLLRVLSRRLQAHRLRVAMTATTGVAGCHIGGSTFHHAMGVSSNGEFLRRGCLLDYDVIIIDEVSMFPLRLFEDFDKVLREEAGTPDLPFGGVQIILCGDFLQLGCINERSMIESKIFQRDFLKIKLQTIVRQSAFPKFAADLQLMRIGLVPGDLTQTVQQLPPGTMVESAVNLLPTNKEVHAANEKELERLEGDPLTLSPETGITNLKYETTATLLLRTAPDFNEQVFSQHVRSLLQSSLELPKSSLLCLYRIYEDGHVMRVILPPGESVTWREAMRERFLEVAGLINDLELGATVTEILPNGDGLHTPENEEYLMKLMSNHPIAQPITFKKGCRVLLRSNLTHNLVNGSIGTVVDFVECKVESFPEYIRNENVNECIERYRIFCFTECGMPIPMVPVVRFYTGETIAIPPWEFTVGGTPTTNYYSLSSVALPLSLAYAFTVHKVQGLTLVGRVHLELSRMWPCEHLLYVAMSRVRNPEQLSMSSFSPKMVVANEDCVSFDNKLQNALDYDERLLAKYPVSSWKRCNDTIYHLRRQGASLRQLLQSATARRGEEQAASATPGTTQDRQSTPEVDGVSVSHLASIEQSVLVARRMRKLIQHVERVAKVSEARKKARALAKAMNQHNVSQGNEEAVIPLSEETEAENSDENHFNGEKEFVL